MAENKLNRDFHAQKPNEKWLTDVTEFKWYEGAEVHKPYLSAILDLYDRRIVSYVISDRNDNAIVFDTFKAAVKPILTHILCSTATVAFSIQVTLFTTCWMIRE